MKQTLRIEPKKPFRIYLPREIVEDMGFSGETPFFSNDAVMIILHPNATMERVIESLNIMQDVVKHSDTMNKLINLRPVEEEPASARS